MKWLSASTLLIPQPSAGISPVLCCTYPTQLDELIPANLSALPNARNTLVAKRFGYDASRPTLYFPAMFHGVFYYDFQTTVERQTIEKSVENG